MGACPLNLDVLSFSDTSPGNVRETMVDFIGGLHLSVKYPASEIFVFERWILNDAAKAEL
ncbi:hypothetical protein T10_8748 [Trichinella papuae]|uniref:Uncharacterized protein n=1 Tax=Trichinella papuae TaxID=268474 RepID=A0A0V1M318_9BILA|nr:hypothetical protein T10_8748 [Trichinella papuae]